MAKKPPKVIPVLNVGYSDKDAVIRVTDPKDDSEVGSLDVRGMVPEKTPEPIIKACVRYFAGGARDAVAATQKAGKTLDEVTAAVVKFFKAVTEGTLQFRERGGEGGLSLEQEFAVIAEVMIALGVAKTTEEAIAGIQAKYDVTKKVTTPSRGTAAVGKEGEPGYIKASDDYREEKTSITRPEYRKLKAVTDVAAALAKAEKADSVSELAALGFTKAA